MMNLIRRAAPVFFACLLATVPASAAIITYNTEAAFDLAAPGLPVETFEAGLVNTGAVTTCTGPISNATGSPCFAAGTLLPGVTYDGTLGVSLDLALLGANFPGIGNTSKVLGANFFADTFNIVFTTSVNAVGFDVFAGPVSGNVQISIFDPTNALLGTSIVTVPIGGAFFGVISTSDLIGRVNVASLASTPGELVDNLAFGRSDTAVPEPASMLLLGTGLLGAGVRRWRQRRGVIRN